MMISHIGVLVGGDPRQQIASGRRQRLRQLRLDAATGAIVFMIEECQLMFFLFEYDITLSAVVKPDSVVI